MGTFTHIILMFVSLDHCQGFILRLTIYDQVFYIAAGLLHHRIQRALQDRLCIVSTGNYRKFDHNVSTFINGHCLQTVILVSHCLIIHLNIIHCHGMLRIVVGHFLQTVALEHLCISLLQNPIHALCQVVCIPIVGHITIF